MTQQVAESKKANIVDRVAGRFGIEASGLAQTLKATAFKGQVSDAQMQALLIVADQYGLNPWTKEIYAFPDKCGIVPVVGVDGWSRIINSHAQFDGMDFDQDAESCTCIIYRKDRSRPVRVTEWMSECNRKSGAWVSHPKRMLRHKAMIQCARLAFGFTGIYDQDEADVILEIDVTPDPGIESILQDIRSAPSMERLISVCRDATAEHPDKRASFEKEYSQRKNELQKATQEAVVAEQQPEPVMTEEEEQTAADLGWGERDDDVPGI